MKKLIPILALIPLVLLALTPPMMFELDCRINSTFWLWMTFASGFFAFLFLYQKVSVWLKLLVVWCFISCFISRAPFMSFTMFWSAIFCAWYYLLCTKIEDWTPVKKCIQAIFFFVVLLVIMQLFGKDTLLNFKEKIPDILHGGTTPVFATIGNKMIASSFMCMLAPFLIFTPINWILLTMVSFISWSSGAVLSIGAGIAVYSWQFKRFRKLIVVLAILAPLVFAWNTGKVKTFGSAAGRLPVYLKTLKLSVKHPQGYGIGTYKILFPVLCGKEIRKEQPGRQWNNAHNDWLQILFEVGFPGFIFFLGWIISIVLNVLKHKDYMKLAGLTIIATNMLYHFPNRMITAVLIILAFLAYCSQGEENGKCRLG
jgi:hypothetical protein